MCWLCFRKAYVALTCAMCYAIIEIDSCEGVLFMKKRLYSYGMLVLVFLFLLSMVGCSGGHKKNELVGLWTVEDSVVKAEKEFFQESYMVIAEMAYYEGATIEITEDKKYIVNGDVGTYEIVDDTQIDITRQGTTTRDSYILEDGHLTLELFNGQIVVNLKK